MRWLLLAALIGVLALSEATASARITELAVTRVRDAGVFAGKPYREADLQIGGTAAGRPYRVPALLAYPARRSDADGSAIVDPYNTIQFADPGFPLERSLTREAHRFLGDEHVYGRGSVYLAVLWDKAVLDTQHLGVMGDARDAYQVLRDAAALVRFPRSMPYPRRFDRPPPASEVVAFGYSASANLLRRFYLEHENTREGLAFDGALLGGTQASCMDPAASGSFFVCGGVIGDGGKVMIVNTQADVEFAGFLERGRTRSYRVLELAGVAHIPVGVIDFRAHGSPNQNPIHPGPALRAAHDNLLRWIKGSPPPEAAPIRLQDVAPQDLGGFPYVPSAHDSDGNAIGGLRLPHMTSTALAGKPAGAPLGAYEGLNFSAPDAYSFFGGTFFPFPQSRLRALYPTREVYVKRVRRAADALLHRRLILAADRDVYVRAAERLPWP
jgi:hypothetical protein